MTRAWFYLDALNRPRGPVSDIELDGILSRADHFVFSEGMEGWVLGSELFARDDVAPLGAASPLDQDDHGQPRNRRYGQARRADREVQELLGLARGMIADGDVSEREAIALRRWLQVNTDALEVWPINVIAARIQRVFADGVVDQDEREELLALLQSTTGEKPDTPSEMNRSTRLPLDDPAPTLRFADNVYVFTGKFVTGTRAACQQIVTARGGKAENAITARTNVLVIGTLGNDMWIQSTHGRKIEKAVQYRTGGAPLSIVCEEHWVTQLRA